MPNFSVDYSKLQEAMNKKKYKLADVKDRIEKVAFDVVRFKDSDAGANLWEVQHADDGQQYIVALYQEEELEKTAGWEVELSKIGNNLQFYYKGEAIVRVANNKLGIPNTEVGKAVEYLPSRLAENKKLVKALLNELPASSKEEVLVKYPELA